MDCRHCLSIQRAILKFTSPNLTNGGEKNHQEMLAGSHMQHNLEFRLAAEDKLISLFGTRAERAFRQTAAGLLLL